MIHHWDFHLTLTADPSNAGWETTISRHTAHCSAVIGRVTILLMERSDRRWKELTLLQYAGHFGPGRAGLLSLNRVRETEPCSLFPPLSALTMLCCARFRRMYRKICFVEQSKVVRKPLPMSGILFSCVDWFRSPK